MRLRQRECGHRRDQLPHAPHDEEEREHEQQMVVSEQDVLDAVHEIRTRHGDGSPRGWNREPRLRRMDERRGMRAIA